MEEADGVYDGACQVGAETRLRVARPLVLAAGFSRLGAMANLEILINYNVLYKAQKERNRESYCACAVVVP